MPDEPVIKRRKEAQKLLDTPVEKKGFETAASGSQIKNEDIAARVEPLTGLWNRGERSKPGRMMIHVDATNPEDPKVTFPEIGSKILGVVNLNTGKKRKTLVSFRVLAVIKTANVFKCQINWDWLVWVATKHPLPPDSTSTLVESLDLENGKVTVFKKVQDIVGAGLVSLCPAEEQAKDVVGLKYGKVTERLAGLIRTTCRPPKGADENA